MDWTEIKKKLKAGDAGALHGLCIREAPAFTKIGNEEVAGFLDRLVAERETFETVEAWHARLDVVAGGALFGLSERSVRHTFRRLVRIVEAVSEVTDAEAFPTEENREQARMAAVLRQRRPEPVPVDPTLQGRMDLPLPPEAMTTIVTAHVRAWLFEMVDEPLPSPVKRYIRARQWGEGRVAARVHLFDGSPATIYVNGAPKRGVMPNIRHRGGGFFFHRSEWTWMRAEPGQTHSDMCDKHGDDFV